MDPVEFGGGNSPAPEPQQDQSLKNVFLSEVDPNDRPTLEKYVDQWDAGATKRFQKYSESLKGYEALGTVEELQRIRQFVQAFDKDPEAVFRAMYEGLSEQYGDAFDDELIRILQIQQEENMSEDYDYENGEPDPNEVWRGNVENDLNEVREFIEQQRADAEYQENSRQLDAVLKAMHNAVGDFDDDFIVARLQVHGNPKKAFEEFQSVIGKYGGKTAPRQAPITLGGQGGVPSQDIKPNKLRGNDRRALVAQLLEGNG